jgi:aryl-alcohol dehydrogenase-like predicted oxidoreductase
MTVETRTLGRTGLSVSLLGLGGGGNSRLGLSTGQSEEHAADVVRAALDLGINLIDTARVYQTERAVGMAIQGRRREQVVISSKSPYLDTNGVLLTAQAFQENLETSLRELGVEMIDIYFIHGLRLDFYEASRERFLPVLEHARRAGKIRFFGITEAFERDTRHEMLGHIVSKHAARDGTAHGDVTHHHAAYDNAWDIFMVGFNILNQSARERVLAVTRQEGIATLGMFAVRRGLIDENLLRVLLQRLAENGEIEPALAAAPDLMESLGLRGVSETLSEAAYRFSAYEPGMDSVLSGTSNAEHLKANLAAVQKGPLPVHTQERLRKIFGNVDSLSGQVR